MAKKYVIEGSSPVAPPAASCQVLAATPPASQPPTPAPAPQIFPTSQWKSTVAKHPRPALSPPLPSLCCAAGKNCLGPCSTPYCVLRLLPMNALAEKRKPGRPHSMPHLRPPALDLACPNNNLCSSLPVKA